MAGSKKSKSADRPALRGFPALLLRGPVAGTLLMAALLAGGWYLVWGVVANDVLTSSQYAVRLENIAITPPPQWVHSDGRAEGYRTAAPDGPLSVLDDHLVKRIADSFALHPWVAEVHRVTKLAGARVQVDLSYRQPVAMVEVPSGTGVLPVDVGGAWLPSVDFSPVEASRYPRIVGIQTMPVGPVGTPWGDVRVTGGAEVAATLLPLWISLKFERIEPSDKADGAGTYTYQVYTRSGTRISWGRSPGATPPDPVPAAEKLARLQQVVAEQGTLDGAQGPLQIDLRDPRGVHIAPLSRTARGSGESTR